MCLHWAQSTLSLYDRQVNDFYNFCSSQGLSFPPEDSASIASYMCNLADKSQRPQAVLKTTRVALQHLYKALDLPSPLDSEELTLLQSALVKSGKTLPMSRSKVMPIAPFRQLFLSWEPNDELPIKQLRLKSLTLLALTLMLRPSDIAPKSVTYNPISGQLVPQLFSTRYITFHDNGSASIIFHGIKNDTTICGFEVLLPCDENARLDPVSALKSYITRTDIHRPYPEAPAFLTLQPPFRAIRASTVANLMEEAIRIAGLGNQGYSAKTFRPTGATAAIDSGKHPDIVMKTSRWKTASVFRDHYVHSQPPADFTHDVLLHERQFGHFSAVYLGNIKVLIDYLCSVT